MFEQEIIEAVESIFSLNDKNKYNVSLGFFQGYSTEEVDTLRKRFANVKLHYRDTEGEEISLMSVPIMYQGNKNTVDDFGLTLGDELIVFFSDRTLEQWTQKEGTKTQTLTNTVLDSINHALCIPINTHHTFSDIAAAAIDATVGRRILVKAGKKIQIGNETDELLKLMDRFIGVFSGDVGPFDSPGTGSTGTISIAGAVNEIAAIRASLANIAKV